MKICLVIPTLTMGGAEKVVLQTASALADNGHLVYVYITHKKVHLNIPENVILHIAKTSSILSYVKFIKKNNVNVSISYLERANFYNLLLSFFSDCKVILSIHTPPSDGYSKRSFYKRVFIKFQYLFCAKLNLNFMAISNGIAQELRSFYGISNIKVIPNFINSFVVPKAERIYTSKLEVTFLGRLVKIKGVDILLRAIGRLNEQELNSLHVNIVGDGPDMEETVLLRDNLKLESVVKLCGFIPEPNVILSNSDILVSPSYAEGFGMSILEGIKYGCYILSSKCKYGPIEILDNNTGLRISSFFTSPSVDKGKAIKELSSLLSQAINKKLSINIDLNSQKKILDKYSKNSVVQDLVNYIME